MPYKLRKAPRRDLYWVVNKETGKKHSKEPLAKEQAKAQMRALYAREAGYPRKGSGQSSSKPKASEVSTPEEDTTGQTKSLFDALNPNQKLQFIEAKQANKKPLTPKERDWFRQYLEDEDKRIRNRVVEVRGLPGERGLQALETASREALTQALPFAPTADERRRTMAQRDAPMSGKGRPDFCYFDDLY